MPVFGADPDVEESEFPEYRPSVFIRGVPGKLVSKFAYAPQRKMSHAIGDKEKMILARFFSQALQRGFSPESLEHQIKVFWQTWGAECESPVYVYVSNDMQEKLAESVKIDPPSDPVLRWLFEGMPDRPAPFKHVAPKDVRKCLMSNAGIELRYPDVVADILRQDNSPEWIMEHIRRTNAIVQWHLGESDEWAAPSESMLAILPDELQTTKRRHASLIRPAQPTIHQAIASLKVGSDVRNSRSMEKREMVA